MDPIRKKRIDGVRTQQRKRTSSTRSFGEDGGSKQSISTELSQKTIQQEKDLGAQGESFREPSVKKSQIDVPARKNIDGNTSQSSYVLKDKIMLIGLRVVIAIALLFFIIEQFPSTYIMLEPHLEYQEVDAVISAYKNPNQGQLGFDIIALTDDILVPVTAQGTRPIEEYAHGTITVYNDYSTQPQRLLPETVFESTGGLLFVSDDTEVIIPGRVGELAGSISISVTAIEPGESFNIDSTDFTIPEYREKKLNEKYNGIYAVSEQSFGGGYIGTESYITDEQVMVHRIESVEKLENILKHNILQEKTENYLIVSGSYKIILDEPKVTFDTDTTGTLKQSGTLFALLIGREQLSSYLRSKHLNIDDIDKVQILNTPSFDLQGRNMDNFDYLNTQRADIYIDEEVLLESVVDVDAFLVEIQGSAKKDLVNYFDSRGDIDYAQVNVRPLWKKTVSTYLENINLDIRAFVVRE